MSESLRLFDASLEILPFGEGALLLRRTDDLEDRLVLPRLGERLLKSAGFEDVVATEIELMVVGADGVSAERLQEQVIREIEHQSKSTGESSVPSRKFRLPVSFETGTDWASVLRESGLAREQYVEHVIQTRLVLTMYGFVPGFLYMSGLSETLHCARKAVPDQRAEAGSVAVGGPYFGIYGLETPAGWNVIGHTPVRTVEVRDLPPTPFRIGDEFRIEEISPQSLADLRADPPGLQELRIDA